MADEKKTVKACAVCIKCWDASAIVRMDLDGREPVFTCTGCEEEFGAEDVQTVLDSVKPWAKLLAWVDAYPEADEE